MAAIFFPRNCEPPASDVEHYVFDSVAVAGIKEVLKYSELRLALEVPLKYKAHLIFLHFDKPADRVSVCIHQPAASLARTVAPHRQTDKSIPLAGVVNKSGVVLFNIYQNPPTLFLQDDSHSFSPLLIFYVSAEPAETLDLAANQIGRNRKSGNRKGEDQ